MERHLPGNPRSPADDTATPVRALRHHCWSPRNTRSCMLIVWYFIRVATMQSRDRRSLSGRAMRNGECVMALLLTATTALLPDAAVAQTRAGVVKVPDARI